MYRCAIVVGEADKPDRSSMCTIESSDQFPFNTDCRMIQAIRGVNARTSDLFPDNPEIR